MTSIFVVDDGDLLGEGLVQLSPHGDEPVEVVDVRSNGTEEISSTWVPVSRDPSGRSTSRWCRAGDGDVRTIEETVGLVVCTDRATPYEDLDGDGVDISSQESGDAQVS